MAVSLVAWKRCPAGESWPSAGLRFPRWTRRRALAAKSIWNCSSQAETVLSGARSVSTLAENFWHWEDHRGDGTGFFIPNPPFQKSLVWSAWGELVLVAPTERYELRAYRHDGSLVRIVRRENDVRSPTEADLDSYRADRRRDAERWPTDPGRLYLAALDALPLPESFPAFSAIEVDLLGYLWVREYNLRGEEDRALWTVFDPEGLALGFVETPPALVIYEIGEDYILGKVLDDLRVEYVQLWGLDRAG